MKLANKSILFLLIAYVNMAFSANDGVLTRLDFSSSTSAFGTGHSDIVQVSIEGGYSSGACNTSLAAIRKSETHVVSGALAAFMSEKRVVVVLDPNQQYHGNRCIITDIFVYQ